VTLNTGETLPSMRTLCPTRWTVRHWAIASILKNYKVLLITLDIIQEGHDAKGSGLLNRMQQFGTFFGLKLAHQIFAPAEQCSTNIQAMNITVQEAMKAANVLTSHLCSIRNESTRFYDHQSQWNPNYLEIANCLEGWTMGLLHPISICIQETCIDKLTMRPLIQCQKKLKGTLINQVSN